jgi:endonuclease-3
MPKALSLRSAVSTLRRFYGRPPAPVSRDPFQLILWEQVAYLAPEPKRRQAFQALRTRVGLSPKAIRAAPQATLRQITRLGGSIAAPLRASRLHRSAELVLKRWGGDLRTALRLPVPQARRALAAFPMIGEPGADKILVFTRTARQLPLDSNGLRVLQRLGLTPLAKDYRTSYRQAQEVVAPQLPRQFDWLIAAYYLLRQHGQELCRRSAPDCVSCPMRTRCPSASGPGDGP